MLIYTEIITTRLCYVLDFVFKEHHLNYVLTNDWKKYCDFEGEKLVYSANENTREPFLKASSFLFEEAYRKIELPKKSMWNDEECLEINGVIDPLAAIFYVLSRYEEYSVKFPDKHNRFKSTESIQHTFDWLQIQIVERWVSVFFKTYFPNGFIQYNALKSVRFIPSFDIDNTFAHQWKEGWRTALSVCKDILTGNKARREERNAVLKGGKDPFDSFDEMIEVAQVFPETRIFWHLGDYGKYDTNIHWNEPRHRGFIQSISHLVQVGLHPSYKSNVSDYALESEKERIQTITKKNIDESRQHFLKLFFPITYRRLMQLGFKRDFTMGYADNVGFRAGTAYEHYFFDVKTNNYTSYRIVPFCYMDGTLHEYMHLSVEDSCKLVRKLVKEVKDYGGVMCFIWHNETFAEAGKWNGWKKVFNKTVEAWNE